jgi:hypothetical protein
VRDIFSLALQWYTSSLAGEREEKRGKKHKTFAYMKSARVSYEMDGFLLHTDKYVKINACLSPGPVR